MVLLFGGGVVVWWCFRWWWHNYSQSYPTIITNQFLRMPLTVEESYCLGQAHIQGRSHPD